MSDALLNSIDSLGFSKKYPKYYFSSVIVNGNINYKILNLNSKFSIPVNKLNIWIPIKVSDTVKYNFIQCSSSNDELFISGNYYFLRKYYFSFIECLDNHNIYYMIVKKI